MNDRIRNTYARAYERSERNTFTPLGLASKIILKKREKAGQWYSLQLKVGETLLWMPVSNLRFLNPNTGALVPMPKLQEIGAGVDYFIEVADWFLMKKLESVPIQVRVKATKPKKPRMPKI